jgi:hypothetical protein
LRVSARCHDGRGGLWRSARLLGNRIRVPDYYAKCDPSARSPQKRPWPRRGPISGLEGAHRSRWSPVLRAWLASSSWPAKITARGLRADCCCFPDDGHAQDFAFSRSFIWNGNCGICAGRWRLPASWIGMAHSARRRQVRQCQQTNAGSVELWPRGRGRPGDGRAGWRLLWISARCRQAEDGRAGHETS